MKLKINKRIILLLPVICLGILSITSCKKDKNEDTTPAATGNGTLFFHMHTMVDTNEVEFFDTVYVMNGGRKISVNKSQLYISGIQLIRLDGSVYDVSNVNVLKKQEVEVYTIASVPAGNYKSVRFNVGLSAATNASTPAAADSTLNQPAMWFGATAQPSGFIFVNFQGKIDTTTAANGTVANMQPFTLKMGTNANLKTVTMPDQNYTVSPNQAQYIHMEIDYAKLFNGIQLNINSNYGINTTTDNGTSIGTQISNNIPLMFSYE